MKPSELKHARMSRTPEQDRERERAGSIARPLHQRLRSFTLAVLLLLCPIIAHAATPFSEYLSRVGQAATMAATMADEAADETEIKDTLQTIRTMLPATEDIEFNHQVVHVDNLWLHQTPERWSAQQGKQPVTPAEELEIMAARLSALERRLQTAAQAVPEAAGLHEKLKGLLAQPEYQEELRRESAIERWLNRIIKAIDEFLSRLFGSRGAQQAQPGSTTLRIFRLLLLAATVAAVIFFGLYKLWQRLRQRRQVTESPEMREVLGEMIAEGASSEELFRQAAEMARQGNYRMGIRRAYVALLYELELRGKLQLHRAKTNRDYLREISADQYIYPPVEYMTRSFERAWYGEVETKMEDYSGFVERYREVVTVR